MQVTLGMPEDNPHRGVLDHLSTFAGGVIDVQGWNLSNGWAPLGFSTVTMKPTEHLPFWTFATAGCWQAAKSYHWRSEFVLAGEDERDEHILLLKMAANFHLDPQFSIVPGKVMNIGQPWVAGSGCTHLLATEPFVFLDYFEWPDVNPCTRFIWLVPITASEAAIAESEGVDRLKELLEAAEVVFTDPLRASVAG